MGPIHTPGTAVGVVAPQAHLARNLGLAAAAEPVLVEAAGRLDPPRLRRVLGHLRLVADPDNEPSQAAQRHHRRGLWLAPTWEGMVAVDGLLEPEAGQSLLAALEPLARPTTANDERTGGQRRADALAELARRALEGGRLPQSGGVRPQLMVTVDLDSLLGRPGGLGGGVGGSGPLDPEGCRRLACDAAVTRVLVTRHPTASTSGGPVDPSGSGRPATPTPSGTQGWAIPTNPHRDQESTTPTPGRDQGLAPRLRVAMALLPPVLGGAPSQPLDVGRATRVVQPAQRAALAVRDGGCVFPPAVTGRWLRVRPTICGTGCMAARPTWPIWRCCAGPIIGRSMRAAGGWPARLMAG